MMEGGLWLVGVAFCGGFGCLSICIAAAVWAAWPSKGERPVGRG